MYIDYNIFKSICQSNVNAKGEISKNVINLELQLQRCRNWNQKYGQCLYGLG